MKQVHTFLCKSSNVGDLYKVQLYLKPGITHKIFLKIQLGSRTGEGGKIRWKWELKLRLISAVNAG